MMKLTIAAGVAGYMKKPVTDIREDKVIFAFRDLDGKPYVVTGPRLTIDQARKWVEERVKDFEEYPGSRESFLHKVRRKAVAAQGQLFVAKLKPALDEEGKMELEMMLSPHSHTSTASKEDHLKIVSDPKVTPLRLDASGRLHGKQADEMLDNSGNVFEMEQ